MSRPRTRGRARNWRRGGGEGRLKKMRKARMMALRTPPQMDTSEANASSIIASFNFITGSACAEKPPWRSR